MVAAHLRRNRRARAALGVAATAILAAACSTTGEPAGDEPASVTTTTLTTVAPRPSDGRLTIGVLLPLTGSQIGVPMVEGIEAVIDEINDAGGVLGSPIELIIVDEGSSVSSARIGIDTLTEAGVDAIIGPASSLVALGALERAIEADLVVCSPSATALTLDEYPDDGLLFRTIPSDSLQAVAITREAERTGANTVAIGYLDDPYGRGLARTVAPLIAARNLTITQQVGFTPDQPLESAAATLLADEPDVVIVLADAEFGGQILTAISDELGAGEAPPIIVNDALRSAQGSTAVVGLPNRVRSRIVGVAPQLVSTDLAAESAVLGEPFTTHAIDCAVLIALAAEQAGTDASGDVALAMAAVSAGGSICRSFAACALGIAQGLQIDYAGLSGPVDISPRTGDVTRGRFELFTFDQLGRDETGASFEVSS